MKQLDELHDEYTRDADYPEFRDIHDLLDTVDALESEKALERAAALREAADKFENIGDAVLNESSSPCMDSLNKRQIIALSFAAAQSIVRALIPQADAHALDKLLAEARLEKAEWWAKGHICENSRDCPECKDIAALRAAAGKKQECPSCGSTLRSMPGEIGTGTNDYQTSECRDKWHAVGKVEP
jgi:hypothetical protein